MSGAGAQSEQAFISVSELNRLLNSSLEKQFPLVYLEAEISELTRASSGHVYFTLKDERSQISAVMWRGVAQALQFVPEAGLSVLCHARPNVYHVTGRLQLVVSHMTPAGEGLLRKKFLELKARLELEGLFREDRKRKLPFLPKSIGIVTSRKGAVIHDIMVKIRERMPMLTVYLIDVRVQGEGAAAEIAEAIRHFNETALVDVIVVARGGGSLEDLWAFNEEVVVRAIFASGIPVVSGVGHEVDTTLADLVADLRAPTPTAAAEIVVPRRDDLLQRLSEFERRFGAWERWFTPLIQRVDEFEFRLSRRLVAVFEQQRLRLQGAENRLQSIEPKRLLALLGQRIDLLGQRLGHLWQQSLMQARKQLQLQGNRLRASFTTVHVSRLKQDVLHVRSRLDTSMLKLLVEKRHALEQLSSRLKTLDPKAVLERGYAVVEADGVVLKQSSQTKKGEALHVTLAQGALDVRVEKAS